MPLVTGLQANVFRAISGSLFSSAVNWSRGTVPTGSDVAVIADNCTIDVSRTIGSLIVRAPFTASINTGLTLQVRDTINSLGHISCSGNPTITSVASKNFINSFSPGSSIFIYSGSSRQSVAGTTYNTLRIAGTGNKTLNSNLIVSGNLFFDTAASLDLFSYDMSVSGLTNLGGSLTTYRLIKSKPGNVLFSGGTFQETFGNAKAIDFSGNPNVEVRNGLVITEYVPSQTNILPGYGTWTFSTNNQNLSCLISFLGDVLVSGSINLNLQSSIVSLYKPINGTTGSASLTNRGIIYYYTANAGNNMMRTGSFDFLTHSNSQNYVINGPYTLPYTTYRNLGIGLPGGGPSTGTKFLSGSTVVSGSLTVASSNYLECSSASLEVTGSTYVEASATIYKSNNLGRVIFNGNFRTDLFGGMTSIDFTTGNASAEFRNGIFIQYYQGNTVGFKTGTGSWYFTTNNQAINSTVGNQTGFSTTYDCPIIISGAITLDITNTNLYFNNSINGSEPNSKFKNSSTIYFATSKSLSESFQTGSYDFTSSVNTVGLVGNYSATIPSRFNTFSSLAISGTGIKTMSTSSVISGSLIMGTTGALELGNNNLTLLGNMAGPNDFNNRALFSKSGSGSIIFGGNIVPNSVNFNLSGNPTVEFRNGAYLVNVASFNFGTGSVIFSTNNQTFQFNSTFNFSGSLIVSGGIRLTLGSEGRMNIYNTINGTSASSTLVNNLGMYFYNSSSYTPMATSGTFSYLNPLSTLGYMFDGDLNLPYTQYHNLAVGGTGSKFLSGDTYLSGSFSYDANGTLDCSTYALTVSGAFGIPISNTFIKKNNNIGKLSIYGNAYTNGTTWQLTGNPEIEFRNGLRVLNSTIASQSFGSGSMIFSTNNQIIAANGGLTFANPITVSGSITLTLDGFSGAGSHTFSGSINGTEANSKLAIAANGGTPTITYYNSQAPMLTGSIDFSSSLNTFVYGSGSQDIRGGTYRNLTLNGGGVKTLQGNVSVQNTYTLTPPATLNLNGFTLTNP